MFVTSTRHTFSMGAHQRGFETFLFYKSIEDITRTGRFYDLLLLEKKHDFFYFHILSQVGWKYQDIIEALEAKRKVKGEAFYKGQKEVNKAKTEILKDPKIVKKIAPLQATIEALGHK